MHWINPAQLEPVTGIVDRFLCNPHGELDGLILREGTEVHFPPHLSEPVREVLKPGDPVAIRGLRPSAAPVLAAIALEATACGRVIVDEGPDDKARHKKPRQTLGASGEVVRTLHGPKGNKRGALLTDGTIVRLGKHADKKAVDLLAVGRTLAARGEGVMDGDGGCLEAVLIGVSMEALEPVGGKPAKKAKPKPPEA